MPDLGPLAGALAQLVAPAVAAFLRTSLGMTCLGLALAAASFAWAAQGSTARGVVAALLVLALVGVVGLVLAVKRAVGRTLIVGLRRAELGRKALVPIFERLESGVAGRAAARLPLAQAEGALRGAVEEVVRAEPAGRGLRAALRRRLQARLARGVERVTLARFRERGATEGGVELARVRDELVARVDALLADRLETALRLTTAVLVAVAVAAAAAVALVVREARL